MDKNKINQLVQDQVGILAENKIRPIITNIQNQLVCIENCNKQIESHKANIAACQKQLEAVKAEVLVTAATLSESAAAAATK